MVMYKLGYRLPVYIPIGHTAAELDAYQDSVFDKISYLINKAHAGTVRLGLHDMEKKEYET